MGNYFVIVILCIILLLVFCVNLNVSDGTRERSMRDEPDSEEQDIQRPLQMNDMTLDEYKKTCNQAFDIDDGGPAIISTPKSDGNMIPYGKYATGIDCEWSIIGNRDCIPQFKCFYVDIRKMDELSVADGLGRQKVIRGHENPFKNPVTPSFNAFELYLKLNISKSRSFAKKYKGFKCLASCKKVYVPVVLLDVSKKTTRKFTKDCTCGLQQTKGKRIVGGVDAFLKEFPWQAAMVEKGTRKIRCGASLINDRYVLSASHCVVQDGNTISPSKIDILLHAHLLDQHVLKDSKDVPLGEKGSIRSPGWNLSQTTDKQEKTIRVAVAEIISHYSYSDRTLDYDICLLRLAKPVKFPDDRITSICLPRQGLNEKHLVGKNLTVVGWGLADENAGASTRLLQKLELPFQERSYCEKINKRKLTDRMLCSGFIKGKKDACTGDSGGPLINEDQVQAVQVGIVSNGIGCARENHFGIYTKVSELVQWIYYHSKGAVWCKEHI